MVGFLSMILPLLLLGAFVFILFLRRALAIRGINIPIIFVLLAMFAAVVVISILFNVIV